MSKRTIVLYWLLLLVPALVIGTAASVLICREQDRINQQARIAIVDRARSIADNVKFSVLTVQESMTDTLKRLDDNDLVTALVEWEEGNPLVRNTFIWDPARGLIHPSRGDEAPVESRLFVQRYDSLFTGRIPWERLPEDSVAIAAVQQDSSWDYNRQASRSRGRLRQMARKNPKGKSRMAQAGASGEMNYAREGTTKHGWKPWYADEHLYMIGWIQKGPGAPVYGLEVEMMWLLAQILADLPRDAPADLVYALMDGNGGIIHQCSGPPLADNAQPKFLVPLAPFLPHWQIGVFFPGDGPAAMTSRSFMILWIFLLFIFMASILTGYYLLTRQARAHMIDARQKTSFVSNVSHELKTPLTSIRMYAELMKEKRVADPAKVAGYLGVIVSESQRLTRLVNNVLDFGRLEQGRKKYRYEDVELARCLLDILETQSLRIREAGLELSTVIPDGDFTVTIDRDAFEQTILNLIDNAIKYSGDGKSIEVTLDMSETGPRVCVMDRGPGIPEEHREKIFEKFHRVEDSLTATKPGSGLGLAITRRLMRDMGGDLMYEPRDGGGSTFVVTFERRR